MKSTKLIIGIAVSVVAVVAIVLAIALSGESHTHEFGEWDVTKKPTCSEKGTKVRYCACGENIRKLRLAYPTKLSQRGLADKMQLIGVDVDKNAIQRIECGKRFVTDIELKAFAEIFDVSLDALI